MNRITLANPRGFCAGVDRAIEIVHRALEKYGAPVYVRNQVVHNRTVVEGLRDKGAVFVSSLDEVPNGALVIFSAHGVAREVHEAARKRGLRVFDATCPLVTKVHNEVTRFSREGFDCVLIGHSGHPEVQGTLGQFDHRYGGHIHLVENEQDVALLDLEDTEKLAYVTQTTLSVDDTSRIIEALKERFPRIKGPRKDDICYATQNRQDAVKLLARDCQLVLVVGSPNSSNSNRLRELAEKEGRRAYLIDNAGDIDPAWLAGAMTIGVTAGASAPESLVQSVVDHLRDLGVTAVEEVTGIVETVVFALPVELRD